MSNATYYITMKVFNCYFCADYIGLSEFVCAACYTLLPWNYCCCEVCALPQMMGSCVAGVCSRCLLSKSNIVLKSAFLYEDPVIQIIRALKYNSKLEFADFIAKSILNYVLTRPGFICPDVFVPVPIHKKRLRQRGFNQALEVAKVLGGILNVQIDYSSCLKVKHTRPQVDCSKSARVVNVAGSFVVVGNLKGARVVVIDDVVTTGSTVNLLANVLYKSGVKSVIVWSFARRVI
ncbi:MAG: ComF family protein [Legionellales bacterium]|nr:ComF family protein [Legionellales bacterium]